MCGLKLLPIWPRASTGSSHASSSFFLRNGRSGFGRNPPATSSANPQQSSLRQYLYFCTSKARKLRTWSKLSNLHKALPYGGERPQIFHDDLHMSAYVSICQHMSAYVSICQHMSAYVSIRQHTSACRFSMMTSLCRAWTSEEGSPFMPACSTEASPSAACRRSSCVSICTFVPVKQVK
jgi:hypothetical protein